MDTKRGLNMATVASIAIFFILIQLSTGFHVRSLHSTRITRSWASIVDSNEMETQSTYKSYTSNSRSSNDISDLPKLSRMDKINLMNNKRVQSQSRRGREGYGWVALEVKASSEEVFRTLSDFSRYEDMIPTVRAARVVTLNNETAIAEYKLSRFRLPVSVVQTINYDQKIIRFQLDPNRPNPAISQVDGYWYVETSESREEYTRVWLYANVVASRLLPTMIVDYAASRALPRATEWLQSYFKKPSSSSTATTTTTSSS